MNKSLVSACIITFNHETFIKDCIEGALNQKIGYPYEIIIGEDFSTDKTKEICLVYAQMFPEKIKLICNPQNLGMNGNWVKSLSSCTGKYIAICEGDDFWIDPLKLQKQVDFLEQHNEYVLSFHNVIAVNVIDDKRTKSDLEQEVLKKDPEDIPVGHPTHTSSMLFRNVINSFPADIDKIVSVDSYLQFVLARYGKSTFQKEIYPNVRRRHPQSVWSYKSQEYKIEQGIILYEKLLEIAINKKEVKYLSKILIKSRTRHFKFLWNNHNRRESFKCLYKTSKEAFKYKIFWYFVLYNLNDLFSLSQGAEFLKKNFRNRLQ